MDGSKVTIAKDVTEREAAIAVLGKEELEGDTRGMIKLSDYLYEKKEVPVTTLQRHFRTFLQSLRDVLDDVPEDFGTLALDTVSFAAEISAKGSITLIGGAEVGGKGGITITLKRRIDATHSTS